MGHLQTDYETDFLVLGGGIAGLRAALELARHGRVMVLNKGPGFEGSSQYAQAGVAVSMGGKAEQKVHIRDTLKAGMGMCDEAAVQILISEGTERIEELLHWGAQFDQKEGEFLFAQEAGHSNPRVLRSRGDQTGEEIVRTLFRQIHQQKRIRIQDNHFVLDLIISEGRCCGAWVLDEQKGKGFFVQAGATILATGGSGEIYRRSTNPAVATGDGLGMAYRAGATLEDMEFVQFHPTALCLDDSPAFLLSEAMRGEGAILKNRVGEAFMKRYHAAGDLAPRDVVSRAIQMEMREHATLSVDLDLTHLNPAFVKSRFPMIEQTCQKHGLDITHKPIPVSPAAHFMIGGVRTDLNGKTGIQALYAVGEAASTRVHGANRLGSNSLLEGLVFGARAGRSASREPAEHRPDLRPAGEAERFPMDLTAVRKQVQEIMWEKAGVIRTGDSLQEALKILSGYVVQMTDCVVSREAMETANIVTVAHAIVTAALNREGSLGVHYRADYPDTPGKDWQLHRGMSRSSHSPPA